MLIQVFSISITGLIYFSLAIYLYWMKGFNFKDTQFKILLGMVQILTTFIFTLNYLVMIDELQTEESLKLFSFFGIDSILHFDTDDYSRGHIICEGMLAFLTAYLNRLFIYQFFNSLCGHRTESS